MSLSFTVSAVLSLIPQILLCINQYTKFEVPSFTSYKDMIGVKFKKVT